jgi:hypothetical protein
MSGAMSAIGPKQTSASALHMSAFDPKRTLPQPRVRAPSSASLNEYDACAELGGQ